MGYHLCLADPYAKETASQEGQMFYYAYILCYIDDLIVVHHNQRCIMYKIDSFLPLKPGSIGPPVMYFGAKLKKKTYEDGTVARGLSPLMYVHQAVRNVNTFLQE